MLDGRSPAKGQVNLMIVMGVPELGHRMEPVSVSCLCEHRRLIVRFRDDDLANNPDLWRFHMCIAPSGVMFVGFPGLPIVRDWLTSRRSRAESDEVVPLPGDLPGTLRPLARVPER